RERGRPLSESEVRRRREIEGQGEEIRKPESHLAFPEELPGRCRQDGVQEVIVRLEAGGEGAGVPPGYEEEVREGFVVDDRDPDRSDCGVRERRGGEGGKDEDAAAGLRKASHLRSPAPRRLAMSSATIEMAISSGDSAPIGRPMGLCARASSSSENPSARSSSKRAFPFALLPIIPRYASGTPRRRRNARPSVTWPTRASARPQWPAPTTRRCGARSTTSRRMVAVPPQTAPKEFSPVGTKS